jgi:hypothetical protein
MIPARMRVGGAWTDAAILNLSSRGLLLHSAAGPPHGSYVEVRRGQHVIIARVMWISGDRFGVFSQDRLPVEEIVSRPDAPRGKAAPADGGFHERRATVRPADNRHDNSRLAGRVMEFACIAAFGMIAAAGIYGLVGPALAAPLSRASMALGN